MTLFELSSCVINVPVILLVGAKPFLFLHKQRVCGILRPFTIFDIPEFCIFSSVTQLSNVYLELPCPTTVILIIH